MPKPKNITELRDQLCEAFASVQADPRRAIQVKEMANLAGKIIGSIRVQSEYAVRKWQEPDIPFCGPTSGTPLKGSPKLLMPAPKLLMPAPKDAAEQRKDP